MAPLEARPDAVGGPRRRAVVISCEHGGYQVPPELAERIIIAPRVLTSHRGYDSGSREIALALAEHRGAAVILGSISRLVVDLNRSESSSGIFSSYSKALTETARQEILQQYYRPYRARVRAAIETQLAAGADVLHVSVHTFTPVLRGDRRSADIGLLYDPDRPQEKRLAEAWAASLQKLVPRLEVKMNYPYLGTDDGHTTQLRTCFADPQYAGIELEVNQKWVRGSSDRFTHLRTTISQALAEAMAT